MKTDSHHLVKGKGQKPPSVCKEIFSVQTSDETLKKQSLATERCRKDYLGAIKSGDAERRKA
jgi:hypothetical protein